MKIEVEDINTTIAERKVAELLENNSTYFLNGAWGSGKSRFMNGVEKESPKKFIYLDLWKVKDDRTVINITFNKLFKMRALFIKGIVICCVVLSILMSNVVNLGIQTWLLKLGVNDSFLSIIIIFGSLIALFVAVSQFFKIKSDQLYIWMFTRIKYINKVLVIDDFDRVSEAKQLEAYKIFNLLGNKLPIIFIGDFNKIMKNEDNYLQKIIDRQIELPYILHSQNIWNNYFNDLEDKFEFKIENRLKEIFVMEKRNLRDQHHFNDYVNLEFNTRGKLGHVQINQQLLVLYIYLFHKNYYNKLLEGWFPEYELPNSETERKIIWEGLDNATFFNDMEGLIDFILGHNNNYPVDFQTERQMYFLYENVSNLSTSDAFSILNKEKSLIKYIEKSGNYQDDFYKFVSSLFGNSKVNKNEIEVVAKASFQILSQNKYSPLISLVSEKIYQEYIVERENNGYYIDTVEESDSLIIDFFENGYLDELDLSQKIYFFLEVFRSKYIIHYENLLKKYNEELISVINNSDDYKSQEKKEYLIYSQVTYFSRSIIDSKEWSKEIKEKVNELSDESFVRFWELCGFIKIRYSTYENEFYKNIVSVVIINGLYADPRFEEDEYSYEDTVKLFKIELVKIAEKNNWKINEVTSFETSKKYLK